VGFCPKNRAVFDLEKVFSRNGHIEAGDSPLRLGTVPAEREVRSKTQ